MFGLISLPKILLTAAVIFAVWYGFHRFSKRQAPDGKARPRKEEMQESRYAEVTDAEDMAKCPICGTYVPLDAPRSCGRTDCPYPQ